MRDPEVVLHEKEADLARVRSEVEALRTVVPLLDNPLEGLPGLISNGEPPAQSEDTDMAQLELYYPFVKNLRLADKLG